MRSPLARLKRRPPARRGTPEAGFFSTPQALLDHPKPGEVVARGPLHIQGWALFPGSSVARVEVRVTPSPPAGERARLAMERPDVAAVSDHPDAPIAGFEHKVDLSELPAGTSRASVAATAHALDGRELELAPVEFTVGAAPEADGDGGDDVAELRRRAGAAAARVAREPRSGEHRVLVFSHELNYGGAPLYLFEILRRLAREPDLEFELVSMNDGPLRGEFEALGIPVHVTDPFAVTSAARYEGHMGELLAWLAPREFDAAFVNTLGSFAGVDLAGRLGIPAVWAVHESFPPSMFWFTAYPPGTLDPYVRGRGKRALRDAAALVFGADATRRLFTTDAPADRCVVLPYGLEVEEIDAARRSRERAALRAERGIEPDERLVLCLGTVEPRKSQAMLTQAFAQVAGRHPRARLALVGASEHAYCADYRAALREYVRAAGLADRVAIEPVSNDPYGWHAIADVLACASDVESMPRVILEAMAFGTPVLSTRVFGVPELIDDGHTGYLCDTRDMGDMVRGLDRVLGAEEGELSAVARAASDHVRARHETAAFDAGLGALLRGLAANPRALPGDLLGRSAATV